MRAKKRVMHITPEKASERMKKAWRTRRRNAKKSVQKTAKKERVMRTSVFGLRDSLLGLRSDWAKLGRAIDKLIESA